MLLPTHPFVDPSLLTLSHLEHLLLKRPLALTSSISTHRSSWEIPELREGRVKAISDSDGVSYPWYGNTTETVTLTGPTSKPSRLTVSMNDNFYPSVTWAVPISNSNTPMLTHITRDQSFITWLVAMNSVTKVRQETRKRNFVLFARPPTDLTEKRSSFQIKVLTRRVRTVGRHIFQT